jgi:hypothetical protein
MKAEELRIGNYVNILKNIGIPVVGQKWDLWEITSIDISDCIINPKRYNPIELTEKWLIDFGFRKLKRDEFQFHYKSLATYKSFDLFFYFEYKEMYLCFGQFAEESDTVPCKYVHQLQNLYFALTGEELKLKES